MRFGVHLYLQVERKNERKKERLGRKWQEKGFGRRICEMWQVLHVTWTFSQQDASLHALARLYIPSTWISDCRSSGGRSTVNLKKIARQYIAKVVLVFEGRDFLCVRPVFDYWQSILLQFCAGFINSMQVCKRPISFQICSRISAQTEVR